MSGFGFVFSFLWMTSLIVATVTAVNHEADNMLMPPPYRYAWMLVFGSVAAMVGLVGIAVFA